METQIYFPPFVKICDAKGGFFYAMVCVRKGRMGAGVCVCVWGAKVGQKQKQRSRFCRHVCLHA